MEGSTVYLEAGNKVSEPIDVEACLNMILIETGRHITLSELVRSIPQHLTYSYLFLQFFLLSEETEK
jgi:hypothetical protein